MTPAELELQDLAFITEDDLPSDDDEKMETGRHKMQMDLLIETLRPWLDTRPDGGFTGGNMFVYYSPNQVKNQDFKGPDFFAAVGVSNRERKSWVCGQEGKPPDVVIELLSESTASFDKKQKKQVYQDRLKVGEYIWFDPWEPSDWAGFRLQSGSFVEIPIDAQGQMPIRALDLVLIQWEGRYAGVDTVWLRWARRDNVLLPTQEELARQAQRRANQAEIQAEQAQLRANQAEIQVRQVIQNLAQIGMSVEQIAQVAGVSIEQVDRALNP
ncbi:MAG: Uma2 family endonuclease [Plectolyngbya sp. WJT66-NPBG17]|jgi:Uma2 family endonuclease|nr:Uma2 family endonuclease [Plectolyngbya sp. WJT66-NPBG17]MBW4525016.1 Uma2 family endonuclease [Phormidium tanganyikae FI6-MK23]